ncbi:hypothetical protein SAMN04515674_102181 [Pseudarcicella hirudinis]|uniref:Lipoprotein n=1 Tax=Pseudarcicella hirudinis TaxID=1079859 RepID=A0A1I5P022_9BACT|nr:hypothetical protein [Pseudarcicella hirudinis]SFP26866.1 hypothetical protein SAMN04515674_102181 [Pseudarcicella hirudinis]
MRKYIGLIVLFLVLSSCATQKMVSLSPVNDPSERVMDGFHVVKQEKDSVRIVTSFIEHWENYLVFDTEIFNLSNRTLNFSPQDFNAFYLKAGQDSIKNNNNPLYALNYSGLNPNEELDKVKVERAREKARLKTTKVLSVLAFVGGAALAISENSGRSRSYDQMFNKAQNANLIFNMGYAIAATTSVLGESRFANRMDYLAYKENLWNNELLKDNAIAPQRSLRGRLYIKAVPEAETVLLNFPTEYGKISFTFGQQILDKHL